MTAIVVTIPRSEKKNILKEDLFATSPEAQAEKVRQYWSVYKGPKELWIGDRVYFLYDGWIDYFHFFIGYQQDIACEVTGRLWPGLNLVLDYPPTPVVAMQMRGFQGFHYFRGDPLLTFDEAKNYNHAPISYRGNPHGH